MGCNPLARYDKYDPYSGGFRAQLAADFGTLSNSADLGKIWAVALNTSGKVIKAVASADTVGLMIVTMEKYAGDVVDIMTHGEIVDILQTTPWDNLGLLPAAGLDVYSATGGALNQTATSQKKVGFFVEPTRLVVRVATAGSGD